MIYSRKIDIFKCRYAHVAHIHLSFGCTDEKIGFGLYSDTYGKFSNLKKSKMWKLESCNVSGNVFRISKNPDTDKSRKSEKSRQLGSTVNNRLSLPTGMVKKNTCLGSTHAGVTQTSRTCNKVHACLHELRYWRDDNAARNYTLAAPAMYIF